MTLCVRAAGWVLLGLLSTTAVPATAQQIRYYHLDAIGSVRAISDSAGAIVERHDYLPFGEECTTGTCAANPGLGGGQPRKFTGKERDPETGLDYFGARYYYSCVGRFASVDPVMPLDQNAFDPLRWNRYAQARNNPLRYVDPDGRDIVDYFGGVANAFGSNFLFGTGRVTRDNADYQFGQFVGDVFSVPAGFSVANTGFGAAGLGVVGAPETAGASLTVTAGGVVLVAAGGSATLRGGRNAGTYLASKIDELTGGSRRRAVRSLEARVSEHQAKLEAYRRDPDAYDNEGFLRNAPNDEVRQRIIEGRIRHLENEIKAFEDQLSKLRE